MDPAKKEKSKKVLAEILAEEDRRFFRHQPQVSPPLPTYIMGSIKNQSGSPSPKPFEPSSSRPSIPTSNYYSALVTSPKTPEKKSRMIPLPYNPANAPVSIATRRSLSPIKPISPTQKKVYEPMVNKVETLVLSLEPSDSSRPLKEILAQNFPKGIYFFMDHPLKTREYYEQILLETQSVRIEHIPDKRFPQNIGYSKIRILKVLTLEEWGAHPFTPKRFSKIIDERGEAHYNYHDYRKAWLRTLFLKPIYHTWFIYFAKNCQRTFPNWWMDWFVDLSPKKGLFPSDIEKAQKVFAEYASLDGMTSDSLLQFIITFGLSWIIGWEFEVRNDDPFKPSIRRQI